MHLSLGKFKGRLMAAESMFRWSEAALAWVYPRVCQLCEKEPATVDEGYVCRKCWLAVRFIREPFCDKCGLPSEGQITSSFVCANCHDAELHFSFARSAVAAKGVVLEAIHRFKYQRALWFEPFLADLLWRSAAPTLQNSNWQMVVPVPLHAVKKREREFNQAERLAADLARRLKLPMRTDLLRRLQPTRTQTQLSKRERAQNVRQAFAAGTAVKLDGANVILVDDVLTTGATTSVCARVLKRLGANEVCVWTVARGI